MLFNRKATNISFYNANLHHLKEQLKADSLLTEISRFHDYGQEFAF